MRKFLIKIKCFFNFHSWSYYPSFNRLICQNTIETVCNYCDARKTIIKKKCIHDWKEITSTNRSGKSICATLFCTKCKETIIK